MAATRPAMSGSGTMRSTRRSMTLFRTPNGRRIGPLGSTRREPLVLDETENSHLKALLGSRTWKVYRATPLYNYREDEASLKQYSRSLSACIKAEAQKGMFIDASVPGDATMTTVSGFAVGVYDPKALHIQVKGKVKNGNQEKTVYEAVLFSTDLEISPVKPSQRHKLTYFTTMISQGPEILSQTVQGWLEAQFDCLVKPLKFAADELKCMAVMLTSLREDHRPLELIYKTPSEIEGLDTINYATEAPDCLRLLDSVRVSDTDVITCQEVGHFISGLEGHFYECFKIKLSAMSLYSMDSSVAFADRDGKIRFYTKKSENILKFCRHLTDLSFEQLKGFE